MWERRTRTKEKLKVYYNIIGLQWTSGFVLLCACASCCASLSHVQIIVLLPPSLATSLSLSLSLSSSHCLAFRSLLALNLFVSSLSVSLSLSSSLSLVSLPLRKAVSTVGFLSPPRPSVRSLFISFLSPAVELRFRPFQNQTIAPLVSNKVDYES